MTRSAHVRARDHKINIARLCGVAGLLCLMPRAVTAQDATPPIVEIAPTGPTFATSTVTVTVDWCDSESLLNSTSRRITVNGALVTSSFNFVSTAKAGCMSHATSTGTITLVEGNNQVSAEIADKWANLGSQYINYVRNSSLPLVVVTPKNMVVSPEPTNQATQSFGVQSYAGATTTFALGPVCPPTYNCSGPSTVSIAAGAAGAAVVSYTPQSLADSGLVKLAATGAGGTDTGWVKVSPRWASHLVVSSSFNNGDLQSSALCATDCFAATVVYGTVPYYSMDGARSVALRYDSDRINPRTPVYADVSFTAGVSAPTELALEVLDSATSAAYTFANGDTKLRFTGTLGPVRLSGVLKTESKTTGAHPVKIVVTADHGPDHLDVVTGYARLLIVNTVASPIAKGWGVAGLPRVHGDSAHGAMIYADAGTSAAYFRYQGAGLPWESPEGDHSTLTWDTSFVRTFDDGTSLRFDRLGRARRVTDRFGNVARFEYDGTSQRLARVYDPYRSRTGGADTAYIELVYNAAGLSQIIEPGPITAPTTGRVTTFSVVSGELRQITDPDAKATSFTYDSLVHLKTVTNHYGATARYGYDDQSWKLIRTESPAVPVDDGASGTILDTAVVVLRPWQAFGAPRAPTSATNRAPTYPADSTRAVMTDPGGHAASYTADRWGQPLRAVGVDGRATVVTRSGILPVRISHPNGTQDTLAYTSKGYVRLSQISGQSAVEYEYGAFQQITRVLVGGTETERRYLATGNGQVDSIRYAAIDSLKRRMRYDSRGRILADSDAKAHVTRYRYDAVTGNTDSVSAPGDRWQTRRFDRYGRDSLVQTSGGDPRRVLYDVLNRAVAQYAGPSASPVTYAYDSLSTRITDPKGQTYRTDVNVLGWVTRRYDPDGTKGYLAYRYDIEGKPTAVTNRRLQTIRYTYDSLHRVTSKNGTNALGATYSYTADGRQTVAAGAVDTVTTYLNGSYQLDSTVTRMGGQ